MVDHFQKMLDLHNKTARMERLAYGVNIQAALSKPYGQWSWSFGFDGYGGKSAGPAVHAKPLNEMKGARGLNHAEQVSDQA
jgi:hypothetical protein